MARQAIELTGLGDGAWSGAVLLDPDLVKGGGAVYLRHIRRVVNSIQVRLAATASAAPDDAGPEFTDTFETAERAFTFTAGEDSVVLHGPGHPGNSFADASEPYFWTPNNGADMAAWFSRNFGDFTLTLDDGFEGIRLHGAAESGAPQAVARIETLPALALSDFDTTDLDVDALALLRAGAGRNNTLYAAPPRGSVGELLDGELGLGESEAAINRIRRRNSTMLLVNDSDPLSLAAYFGAGGAGADLTLYVQTLAGVASIAVSAHTRPGDNVIQFGAVDSDFRALLDGIDAGDRFIFALARPARAVAALRGAAQAGAPEAGARVLRVAPTILGIRGAAATGEAGAQARVLVGRVHIVRGVAAAAAPQARGRLQTIRIVRGAEARAGVPQAALRLSLVRARLIRGAAAAGGPAALARLRAHDPAALFARWQREGAPGDSVVTALEIRHPAVARPVRVVNDTVNRRIEGHEYIALRFDARLADDIAGQAPQAELSIDNIGRELTQWIEAAGGGIGATVCVMLVLAVPNPSVEWELTLDVAGVHVDQERVTARLGFDPLLGAAAVRLRHDPQTSPGIF